MAKVYRKRKEEERERKDSTYDERKAETLAHGKRVEYLTCPICGRNRVLKNSWGKKATFEVKPTFDIIQVRYGGGRGSGFFRSDDEGVKLDDLQKYYPEIFDNLKEEVEKLHKLLMEDEEGVTQLAELFDKD